MIFSQFFGGVIQIQAAAIVYAPEIIGDRSLVDGFVLCIQATNDTSFFIQQHRNAGPLGLSHNMLFLDVPHLAVLILRQTGFHNSRQDRFFGKALFTGHVHSFYL